MDDPIELAIVEKKFEIDISFLITHVNLTFLYKPAFYSCKAILCAFANNKPNSDNEVLRCLEVELAVDFGSWACL